MRLFKRRRGVTTASDKVAGTIAGGIISVQTKFSERMNKIVSKMTIQRVKTWLIIFCVFSGGLSIYFIVSSLRAKHVPPLRIERMRIPENLNRAGDEVMENKMDASIYERIQAYKRYMDSIGEPIRSSLRDSIAMLEEIYLQQQK